MGVRTLAKYTYGYLLSVPQNEGVKDAIAKARADGFIGANDQVGTFEVSVLRTPDLEASEGKYAVVIRTNETD